MALNWQDKVVARAVKRGPNIQMTSVFVRHVGRRHFLVRYCEVHFRFGRALACAGKMYTPSRRCSATSRAVFRSSSDCGVISCKDWFPIILRLCSISAPSLPRTPIVTKSSILCSRLLPFAPLSLHTTSTSARIPAPAKTGIWLHKAEWVSS